MLTRFKSVCHCKPIGRFSREYVSEMRCHMLRTIARSRTLAMLGVSIILCGVMLVSGVAVSSAQSGFGASKGLPKHHQTPDFQLQTVDGTVLSKAALKGQPTLMMFWAPWCHVCQMELPKIHDFHEAVKSHGLQVLSIGEEGIPYSDYPLRNSLSCPLWRVMRFPLLTASRLFFSVLIPCSAPRYC